MKKALVALNGLRGLAFAYQAKPEDVSNEWILQSNLPVRRVVRKISKSF